MVGTYNKKLTTTIPTLVQENTPRDKGFIQQHNPGTSTMSQTPSYPAITAARNILMGMKYSMKFNAYHLPFLLES